MSISIKYRGSEILSSSASETKTLLTSGKYCDDNIIVTNVETAIPTEADINFYDYDGTLLYAWTIEELAGKTELPPLPSHEGLVCQGWNWTLADLKATNRMMNVGAIYITDDGTTRIYIHLEEGRTSPILGVCPNGTVTVDWGDGTEPDTLTGSSTTTVQWTPRHNYAAPGDYVIRLTVDGSMGFYANGNVCQLISNGAAGGNLTRLYINTIRKIEIGNGVTAIVSYAFSYCFSLCTVTTPIGVKSILDYAFQQCFSFQAFVSPTGMASIYDAVFQRCYSIRMISINHDISVVRYSATSICQALPSIALPDTTTTLYASQMNNDYSLNSFDIPSGVTVIQTSAFRYCYSLRSITIPAGVKTLDSQAFQGCASLAFVEFKGNVETIGANTFDGCNAVAYYDFTNCTAVPTLADANAFTGIPDDCEIRVPAQLMDAWKAATNWATYADHMVSIGTT